VAEGNVKGAAIQAAWMRVNELLETGRITREQLEARLSPRALEIVEQKILPSLWYSIAAGAEISQLVADVDGGGNTSHMTKLGAETAHRFLAGGTFKDFIEGATHNRTRRGESLVRLAELMLDFGDWHFEGDDLLDFKVVVTEAEQLPETTRFSIQGFIAVLTTEISKQQIICDSQRPSPDTVVFSGQASA
jgi:hypothetical protein